MGGGKETLRTRLKQNYVVGECSQALHRLFTKSAQKNVVQTCLNVFKGVQIARPNPKRDTFSSVCKNNFHFFHKFAEKFARTGMTSVVISKNKFLSAKAYF
jgi:hypothetical protein